MVFPGVCKALLKVALAQATGADKLRSILNRVRVGTLKADCVLLLLPGFLRSGRKEGREAMEALQFVDNERIVQVAMLADAGDEALLVTRFYDTGSHDPGQAASLHDQFRCRIDYLFCQGHCQTLGFTRHALVVLQQTYTVILGETVKRIGGGVCQATFDSALSRMRAWVFLATPTIQSEFCVRRDALPLYVSLGRSRRVWSAREIVAATLGASPKSFTWTRPRCRQSWTWCCLTRQA